MLFGSISYLNLLPFQLFLKQHISDNASKMAFRYKRAVPSKINKALQRREINAAFISSVTSKKCKCTDLGIIANKKVYSVLLLKGEDASDPASASSNHLAKILDLQGQVLIGDAALQYYLSGGEGIDLAEAWHEKTGLPFVFARLCYNKHGKSHSKTGKKVCKYKSEDTAIYFEKRSRKTGDHSQTVNLVFGADLLYDG